jgi:hypothetical protein
LQSIMPAPVRSRSSFTICAVILAMTVILYASWPQLGGHPRRSFVS